MWFKKLKEKIRDIKKMIPKIYTNPSKDGKKYWIPIVTKNRDSLVYYVNGVNRVLKAIETDGIISVDLGIDSSRFTDIIDHKGTQVSKLSQKEKEDILKMKAELMDSKKQHPENGPGILTPAFLDVYCLCGYLHQFKNEFEIPLQNFKCPLCSRLLIQYINHDDFEYIPTIPK